MSSSYYCVNDFETRSCCDVAAGAVQIVLTVQRGRLAWPLAPLRPAVLAVQAGVFFSLLQRGGSHCSSISKHLLFSSSA